MRKQQRTLFRPTRRDVTAIGGALFASAFMPKIAQGASRRDPRFITIILRGALDGLSAVAPLGDPNYATLRGALALRKSGDGAALPLDGFFGLHPSMTTIADLFARKRATIIHAVATGYRERSHFDGQDVLESGQPGPGRTDSGWLNRALLELPKGPGVRAGLAVGAATPLVLRGPAATTGWAPSQLAHADDDLAMRLRDLYAARDPALGAALAQGLAIESVATRDLGDKRPQGAGAAAAMRAIAHGAAKLLAAEDGPRIGALAFDGWDTHIAEGAATGRLAQLLAGLDGAIDEFQRGLGPAWDDTIIVVITEFGRTARVNGASGTDHGVATAAFLAGGAVSGGRVVADWPGLKDAQLYQGRDLKPTIDLRAVLKGALADHLGLSPAVLGDKIFPQTAHLAPVKNLVA